MSVDKVIHIDAVKSTEAVTITLEHDRPYDPEFVRATFAMFFTHGDRIEIEQVRWL